jgi:transcriptional regulator with XRE-family HTH domain
MKQGELAKRLGISRTYLNGILNGKRRPSIKLAKKISKITGKNFFEMRPDIKKLISEVM